MKAAIPAALNKITAMPTTHISRCGGFLTCVFIFNFLSG
jgi:hypothetical protein